MATLPQAGGTSVAPFTNSPLECTCINDVVHVMDGREGRGKRYMCGIEYTRFF
jgi:hypothetical protein